MQGVGEGVEMEKDRERKKGSYSKKSHKPIIKKDSQYDQ